MVGREGGRRQLRKYILHCFTDYLILKSPGMIAPSVPLAFYFWSSIFGFIAYCVTCIKVGAYSVLKEMRN